MTEKAPTKDEYYAQIRTAAAVHDVDLLVQLWRQAPYVLTKMQTLLARSAINRSVKSLAAFYGMKIPSETSFQEFVRLYDEKIILELLRGDVQDLIEYLKAGGQGRAKRVISFLYSTENQARFPNAKDFGRLLYWFLFKLQSKNDRFAEIDIAYRRFENLNPLKDVLFGMLEEAHKQEIYEPLDFFIYNSGPIIRYSRAGGLYRYLLEIDEYAFYQTLKEGLIRYPETSNKLELLDYDRIITLVNVLKDVPLSIYGEIIDVLRPRLRPLTDAKLSYLLNMPYHPIFHNLFIYTLLEKQDTPDFRVDDKKTLFALVRKYGYDRSFDPCADIKKKNMQRLDAVLAGLEEPTPALEPEESEESTSLHYSTSEEDSFDSLEDSFASLEND